VYNLTRVDSSSAGMAIVYASDALAGMKGKLSAYPQPISQVLGVARLYGGNAHLSVPRSSAITNPFQLKGQRVGVGYPGSATAISAENYFRSIGIWETLVPDYVSYDMAADDFKRGRIAALWQMVGCPSASLAKINRDVPIRLLDLGEAARGAGFFTQYPAYSASVIPAGTYRGIDYSVETFQDQALWVASAKVDEKFIYDALSVLFSEDGRTFLKKVHPIASELSLAEGHQTGSLRLHPGAARFWRDQRTQAGLIGPDS
jgi:TRAP transporter TAXI family solute receptor